MGQASSAETLVSCQKITTGKKKKAKIRYAKPLNSVHPQPFC
jgi:hypothetical protein